MEPDHKRIISERRQEIIASVSLVKIKPLLLEYKMFNRYMWEDIHSMSDVLYLLSSRGPNAFQNIIRILRATDYDKEANSLESTNSVCIPQKYVYQMSSNPLGYCLIINNVNFKDKSWERSGSDVDSKSLEYFFKGIEFDVFVERNLTADEMIVHLEKFSRYDFQNVDSAVVIILSHGDRFNNEDGLYGTDGLYILKSQIVDYFNNKRCPQLQGKPKVFFFIACRGDNKDYGAPKLFPTESPDSVPFNVIPLFTDILIVHSTLPYNISMRDHVKGSWFCQDLITVLEENHSKHDLEAMMKMVNRRLKTRISLEYRVTQVAHVENKAFDFLMLCRNN